MVPESVPSADAVLAEQSTLPAGGGDGEVPGAEGLTGAEADAEPPGAELVGAELVGAELVGGWEAHVTENLRKRLVPAI